MPQRAAADARERDAWAAAGLHDLAMERNPVSGHPAAAGQRTGVVILVEDDDSLRRALVRVLRASGLETRDYESAEALLADRAPDWAGCLVVDLNLPAMSGLELVDLLRQRGTTLPVVAISAHDEAHVRDAVRRRGVERFLGKPFVGTALVRTVNDLIGSRAPHRDMSRDVRDRGS